MAAHDSVEAAPSVIYKRPRLYSRFDDAEYIRLRALDYYYANREERLEYGKQWRANCTEEDRAAIKASKRRYELRKRHESLAERQRKMQERQQERERLKKARIQERQRVTQKRKRDRKKADEKRLLVRLQATYERRRERERRAADRLRRASYIKEERQHEIKRSWEGVKHISNLVKDLSLVGAELTVLVNSDTREITLETRSVYEKKNKSAFAKIQSTMKHGAR